MQNIVFNVLSNYIVYFANMRLPFEKSRNLVVNFSKKYEIDHSRTHLLLSELESLHTTQKYYLTNNDQSIISAKKKNRRNKQFK